MPNVRVAGCHAHLYPLKTLFVLGRCLADDPFRHQNDAPTNQDRQHVTNCKVNIISGLPQEMRAPR
jgi:hypothetical protein